MGRFADIGGRTCRPRIGLKGGRPNTGACVKEAPIVGAGGMGAGGGGLFTGAGIENTRFASVLGRFVSGKKDAL
jgi:hypothetical protein